MSARFTLRIFPRTPQLKDWCGLPWGVAITPLGAESVEHEASDIRAQDVARCDACGGYINPYCQVDIAQRLWQCALCRAHNRLGARYASGRRELLPELTHDAMTYTLAPARAPAGGGPAYLAVVDASAGAGRTLPLLGACGTCLGARRGYRRRRGTIRKPPSPSPPSGATNSNSRVEPMISAWASRGDSVCEWSSTSKPPSTRSPLRAP